MPNKKPTRSAIHFYMEDLQENLRKQGIPFRRMYPDLLDYASPRWKSLTPAEKAPYERKYKEWKAQSNASIVGKMDSKGNLLTETLRLREENERWQRDMNAAIKTLVYTEGNLNAVADLKFHVISFNIFCQTESGEVVPAEFGLVEFSIKDGITKYLHKFIDPGQIPEGYFFECKRNSDDTHQIPVERFEEADSDYDGMYFSILNFINPNRRLDKYPNIFCLPHEIPTVMKICDWINEGGHSRNRELVLEAYDLSILVTYLQNFSADKTPDIGHMTSGLVMDELQKSVFDHTPNISCNFHEEKDLTKYCALSKAKRQVYIILDLLCELYYVPLVTGKHLPGADNDFVPSVVSYPQVSVKSAPDRFTERRSLIQPSTSTIVHGVRSVIAADDYDDSILIQSAMQGMSVSSHSQNAWSKKAAPCAPAKEFALEKKDFPGLEPQPVSGYAVAAAVKFDVLKSSVAPKTSESSEDKGLRLPRSRPMGLPRGIGRGIARGVPLE